MVAAPDLAELYRERLKDKWESLTSTTVQTVARYLVEQGEVDGDRLMITGGSAGGCTTLCALTFRDTFSAGAAITVSAMPKRWPKKRTNLSRGIWMDSWDHHRNSVTFISRGRRSTSPNACLVR